MLNSIIFEKEIILYWDNIKEFSTGCKYRVVSGEKVRITSKTHCKFSELKADTMYTFTV